MANNDWWAKKLSAQPNTSSTPRTSPPVNLPYAHQPGSPNVQVTYDQASDQTMSKAQSSRQSTRCPGCNSGNYMSPPGTNLMRCYDCGYPLVQAGSGVISTSSSGGAAIPAKQPNQGSGFKPNVIVDRIQ